jgi:hypothetical protein
MNLCLQRCRQAKQCKAREKQGDGVEGHSSIFENSDLRFCERQGANGLLI